MTQNSDKPGNPRYDIGVAGTAFDDAVKELTDAGLAEETIPYVPGGEYVGYLARERHRIAAALRECAIDGPLHLELMAAQQALAWVMEPNGFASPFDSIRRSHPDAFPGAPITQEAKQA